jgi:hypothetical protein
VPRTITITISVSVSIKLTISITITITISLTISISIKLTITITIITKTINIIITIMILIMSSLRSYAHIFERNRYTGDKHVGLDPLPILGVRECPFACIKHEAQKKRQHAAARMHQN